MTYRTGRWAPQAHLTDILESAAGLTTPTVPLCDQPHAHAWAPTSIGRDYCLVCMAWRPAEQG